MEQQIHFCTTHDDVQIAYATVGQGPPLLKAANWLSHLEWDCRVRSGGICSVSSHAITPSSVMTSVVTDSPIGRLPIFRSTRGSKIWNQWLRLLNSIAFPLLGISQGGAVAIAYAVRHPEKFRT
jgi:pimeloyl-ACP methyl ester carboxylesterase